MTRRIIKVIAIIFVLVLAYSLIFGKLGILVSILYNEYLKPPVTQFKDFAEYKDDFTAVCDFLRVYYTENACSGKITLDFMDGSIRLISGESISDQANYDITQQVSTVKNKGFSGAWVDERSVIFWEDETKYYGLLFSERPGAAISATKRWYTTMRYKKIDLYWYEIGALGAI